MNESVIGNVPVVGPHGAGTLPPVRRVNPAGVFPASVRLTRVAYESAMDGYMARVMAAVGPDGADLRRLPLGPFGGTLADLGYTHLPPPNGAGGAAGTRPLPAHDYGLRVMLAGVQAVAANRQPRPLGPHARGPGGGDGGAGNDAEPDFPGFDAPAGEIIKWVDFYRKVKAEFPGELSFAEIKKQARNLLIQQGVKFIEGQLKDFAVDTLVGLLGPDLDDAVATAGSGAAQGVLDRVAGFFDDPLGELEGLLASKLPELANKGIDALLGSLFGKDEDLSSGALVAKMAAKEVLSGMADALLAGINDLDDLIANFENLQSKLFGRLKKFFTGREFTPGKAFLALARKDDADDKTDVVVTGLATVMVEGKPAARVTDLLAPSGQPIAIGSATVEIGGLPAGRKTSLTSVPSTIKTGAAKVLVEGVTVGSVTPAGVPYCPADPRAAAAALARKPAPAVKVGQAGKGGQAAGYGAPPGARVPEFSIDQGGKQNNCGPTAARIVIKSETGKDVSPDEIDAQAEYSAEGGVNVDKLPGVLERNGVRGAEYDDNLTMDEIEEEVKDGSPAIVVVDEPDSDMDHVVVVTNVERDANGNRTVIYMEPAGGIYGRRTEEEFERRRPAEEERRVGVVIHGTNRPPDTPVQPPPTPPPEHRPPPVTGDAEIDELLRKRHDDVQRATGDGGRGR